MLVRTAVKKNTGTYGMHANTYIYVTMKSSNNPEIVKVDEKWTGFM